MPYLREGDQETMKKILAFLMVLGVTVCLKPGRHWQPGVHFFLIDVGEKSQSECATFEKSFGSGSGSYIYCFGDYSDQKVCVPQDNVMDTQTK